MPNPFSDPLGAGGIWGPKFGNQQLPSGYTPGYPPGMSGSDFQGGSYPTFDPSSIPGSTPNNFGWGDIGSFIGSVDGQAGFGLGDLLALYGMYNAFKGSSKAGSAATQALGLQSALAGGAAANAQELFAGARPIREKAEELLMNRLAAGPGAGVSMPDLSSVVDTANPFRQNFGAVPRPTAAAAPAPSTGGDGGQQVVTPPVVSTPAEGPSGGHNSPPGAPPRGTGVVPPPVASGGTGVAPSDGLEKRRRGSVPVHAY